MRGYRIAIGPQPSREGQIACNCLRINILTAFLTL
jgi:hypothetical protein